MDGARCFGCTVTAYAAGKENSLKIATNPLHLHLCWGKFLHKFLPGRPELTRPGSVAGPGQKNGIKTVLVNEPV